MPSSAPAFDPAAFSTADAEVQAALAVAEDPRATLEERDEMLMEVARGLQIKPRSAQQLHDAVLLYRRALALVPPGFELLAARIRAREGTAHQALPDGGVQALLDAQDCYEAARADLAARGLPEEAAELDMNLGLVSQSLVGPYGVHWDGARLWVADAGNNRLLMWHSDPVHNMQACDTRIGQADADALDHNCGEYYPTARAFNMPYGLAVHDERLFVTDTVHSRVLRFDSPLLPDAQALAGQAGFTDKGDNRWLAAARDSLCWPYALAIAGDTAVVVDSGNNRVLLWELRDVVR